MQNVCSRHCGVGRDPDWYRSLLNGKFSLVLKSETRLNFYFIFTKVNPLNTTLPGFRPTPE
jgi:hypothetical protein